MRRGEYLPERDADHPSSPVGLDRALIKNQEVSDHRADRQRIRHKDDRGALRLDPQVLAHGRDDCRDIMGHHNAPLGRGESQKHPIIPT